VTSGVGLCSEESKDAALIARESERPRWAVVDQERAAKRMPQARLKERSHGGAFEVNDEASASNADPWQVARSVEIVTSDDSEAA
jgi:hypothetical protein